MNNLCPTCGQPRPHDLPITVDLESNEAVFGAERVQLTTHLARMLDALIDCKGRVATREYLLERGYGLETDWPNDAVVKVRIVALRKILIPRGHQIENVWGRGYRLASLDGGTQ